MGGSRVGSGAVAVPSPMGSSHGTCQGLLGPSKRGGGDTKDTSSRFFNPKYPDGVDSAMDGRTRLSHWGWGYQGVEDRSMQSVGMDGWAQSFVVLSWENLAGNPARGQSCISAGHQRYCVPGNNQESLPGCNARAGAEELNQRDISTHELRRNTKSSPLPWAVFPKKP